jgi:DNA-binding NarL/FixJ family response regulator
MTALRILIASARYSARLRIKLLLENHPEWEICGEARTGGEAVSEARKLKPDIAILDLHMPGLSGQESTKRMRAVSPDTEILVLSAYSADQLTQEMLGAGARGHLLEPDADRNLIVAIQALANHEPFPNSLANRLQTAVAAPSETTPVAADRLRRRPMSALAAAANGGPSGIIANSLFDGTGAMPGRLEGQGEIDRMRQQLAETIALVEPSFQKHLIRISPGHSADLSARDYITEEFFAVAVRFFTVTGAEALPRLCCEIFSGLAPSKYGGLSATKMAQLMSQAAQSFPNRYTGELHRSSFLCVNLLASSDRILGTSHAEKVGTCLLDLAKLLAASGSRSGAAETQIRRMETILKARPTAAREPVARRARATVEAHQADPLASAQDSVSEKIWPPKYDVLPAEPHTENPLGPTQPAPVPPAREPFGIFSRIIPSFGKIKNWLTSPIK